MVGIQVQPCCCPGGVECTHCDGEGDNAPDKFQIDIAGIVNDDILPCDDCGALLDGTYIVENIDTCKWEYREVDLPDVCEFGFIQLILDGVGGSAPNLSVELTFSGEIITWKKSYNGTPIDCKNLSNESIPFFDQGFACDGSNATCKVTSL